MEYRTHSLRKTSINLLEIKSSTSYNFVIPFDNFPNNHYVHFIEKLSLIIKIVE